MNTLLMLIRKNVLSGLTVALVSIPLSLALAIVSGATPTQGLITAFWAGLIGALLGGSSFNIMGPTGALSGILISYSLIHGYAQLPLIAIVSGFLVLVGWALHLDKYIIFIPRSVVHGFTLGIAFIIIVSQLNAALGLQSVHVKTGILDQLYFTISSIFYSNWTVFFVFLCGFCFLLVWKKRNSKIPGHIIVAGVGILAAYGLTLFSDRGSFVILADRYPTLHMSLINPWTFSWHLLLNKDLWLVSSATAIIAILETLLSGQIADKMTKTTFNRSSEMLALGLANIGVGIMGGIPATAVLARTALNIKSGASSRVSGMMSSLSIGFISLFFFDVLKFLPFVVIASILCVVAIGMIEKHHFIQLIENEKVSFVLSLLVAVITVSVNPMVGILIGSCIALLIFVNKISYGQTDIVFYKNGVKLDTLLNNELSQDVYPESDVVVYHFSGTLTYINMPAHLKMVEKIKDKKCVILSLKHSFYADIDGVDYLSDLIELLKHQNDKIVLSGVNKEIKKQILHHDFYKKKQVEKKIYHDVSDALQHAY